jgi:TPR repeat protein
MTTEELLRRLKAKAVEEGISEEFPPLSLKVVQQCEKQMGVTLPELLRLLYTQVANGGIGPGEALMGLKGGLLDDLDHDASMTYNALMSGSGEVWEDFGDEEGDVRLEWIPGVLPVCWWGCGEYTLLDCNAPGGRMVYADLSGVKVNYKEEWENNEIDLFEKPGVAFEDWIASWLDKERQWEYVPGGKPPAVAERPPEPARQPDQLEGESHQEYALRKAAQSGDANAQFEYGAWLCNQSGLNRNGQEWLEKAAQQDHPTACLRLAYAYRDGHFGEFDWDKAAAFADKARPHYRFSFYLGTDDKDGLQAKPRPDQEYPRQWWQQATAWWQKRVQDDVNAAYSFALAHDLGYAPGANPESAASGYKRAAELGHVLAQSRFGTISRSAEWLAEAAKAGDENAQYELWKYYSENDRDWKSALKHLKALAAKSRSAKTLTEVTAHAAIDLARLHLDGRQVEQNSKKAIALLESAAKALPGARYILGKLYLNDPNLRDLDKAIVWLRKGSEWGSYDCFYELGCCHEQGIGVRQDLSRACTLFKIAADKGHEAAEKRLQELRARMS